MSFDSMRICSLLPAATEILFALGLGDDVAGVTHECDFPAEVAGRAVLVRPRIDPRAPAGEIDRQVRACVERGESVYAIDGERLRALAPDLIVTQELCQVCAASPDDLAAVLGRMEKQPRVVMLAPSRLADVWHDIRMIGEATGRAAVAEDVASRLEDRVRAVETRMRQLPRPRVLCLEWLDPPFSAGHWVPEMVEVAGGIPLLANLGEPSVALDWKAIIESRPEAIVLMPCGYNLERTLAEYAQAKLPEGWWELPAVRGRRVSAVDANSYFSRSGPRLAAGVEILARILHPDVAIDPIPPGAVAPAERAR
ncbi:MAG: cobalamin-binding protein [Acidobacteriota bacterium]|nr:cobalamin-binding protein [Acidobacteriota bacterium]